MEAVVQRMRHSLRVTINTESRGFNRGVLYRARRRCTRCGEWRAVEDGPAGKLQSPGKPPKHITPRALSVSSLPKTCFNAYAPNRIVHKMDATVGSNGAAQQQTGSPNGTSKLSQHSPEEAWSAEESSADEATNRSQAGTKRKRPLSVSCET